VFRGLLERLTGIGASATPASIMPPEQTSEQKAASSAQTAKKDFTPSFVKQQMQRLFTPDTDPAEDFVRVELPRTQSEAFKAKAAALKKIDLTPPQHVISVSQSSATEESKETRGISSAIREKTHALQINFAPRPVITPSTSSTETRAPSPPPIDLTEKQVTQSAEDKKATQQKIAAEFKQVQEKRAIEKAQQEMNEVLFAALKKRRQKIEDNSPTPIAPEDVSQILAKGLTQRETLIAANVTAAEITPTFSVEPNAFDHLESVEKLYQSSLPLSQHSDESLSQRSSSNPGIKPINRYRRLASHNIVNSLDSDFSATANAEAASISDLINFYHDISPEFDNLKEKYQNTALTLSPQEATLLFPALKSYQSGSPILNFRDMNNLTYIENTAKNIAANFNKYIAYYLPRLKTHAGMIENDLVDEHRIYQASAAGLEFSEQMRRTSRSALDLLFEAESHMDMSTDKAAEVRNTLSAIIKNLSAARDELFRLQKDIQRYTSKKPEVADEQVNSPLISAFR
jgi:hypothetical protein